MTLAEVDVALHSALVDCPVLEGQARRSFDGAVTASRAFSREVGRFLKDRSPEEQAAWLKTAFAGSRTLFQPWSLEILYVLAMQGRSRFNGLHQLLGLSSRTLSDKLKALREAGLVARDVIDADPIRIEYHLTRHGAATTALAAPLFAQLNLEAVATRDAP